MTDIGTVIDGKYELLKVIGKGGMSVVYLAMDKRLNKQWAVKEILKTGNSEKDEVVENSLLAEANLMKRLDHPMLPRIVDIIDYGTTIYIIMDYIEGESMDRILLEYGAQPEELVIDWAKQLCDALAYLHSQNPPIIYRDMKPANIMLKPEGAIKVFDFGIAREYKENKLADTTVLGTNGYAAPEQHGKRQTDPRSDIYALGMTLHHILTGVDPRPKDYQYYPIRTWNPNLSEGMEAIINKCTAIDPENRYQSCAELMYDLEHPDVITQDFKKKQKRKLSAFIATVAVTLVALIAGISFRIAAVSMKNSDYKELISVETATSFDEKIENYKRAIEIFPNNPQAYLLMLQAYQDNESFTKRDSDEFLAVYNANKSQFDTGSVEYAQLNYQVGMMYFNYYTDDDGEYSFSERIQKAYPFFEHNYGLENLDGEFKEQHLSDCYYEICSFYKNYVLDSVNIEEASKSDYESLFETLNTQMDAVENASAYDQLTLYHGIFMLLYDQRNELATVNMEKESVLDELDAVYSAASKITTQKEQSKLLKGEIIDNYDEYKNAIEATYSNMENVEETEKANQEG